MMKIISGRCGTGNPDHITMEGLKALRAAQLILLPVKGTRKSALADIQRGFLTTHLGTDAPQIQTFEIPSREPDIPINRLCCAGMTRLRTDGRPHLQKHHPLRRWH